MLRASLSETSGMKSSRSICGLTCVSSLVHGPEATFSEIGTTQRDKGSYVFFDRSVYVDNEMR